MKILALILGLLSSYSVNQVFAAPSPGQDWQINFFDAASPVMENIHEFHNWVLMPIITAITLFVLALLIYVVVRFRKGKNPNPSKTTHHVGLEIIWTIVPVLILVVIAIPSIRLLIMQDETPKSDVTIKAIGYQWYWGYEYPEEKVAEFSSYMRCMPESGIFKKECLEKLKAENLPHKLAVDYPLVVPVNKTVRVLITAMDVIHAFAMPSFGVKRDAVPGRMNQTWFKATKIGTFYGQCSELCGVNHAFMPITVEVVPQEIYEKWLEFAKKGDHDAGNVFINKYKSNQLEASDLTPKDVSHGQEIEALALDKADIKATHENEKSNVKFNDSKMILQSNSKENDAKEEVKTAEISDAQESLEIKKQQNDNQNNETQTQKGDAQ